MFEYASHLTGRIVQIFAELDFNPDLPRKWLESVFQYSNRHALVGPSMSVGDMVFTPDGRSWICQSQGFALMSATDHQRWWMQSTSVERHWFAMTGEWK